MLTQCPSCLTTFRITSEILRVADGQVRCGRCQTQFDALQRLMQENDAGEAHSGRFLRVQDRSAPAEPPAAATGEDITLEGDHIESSGRHRAADAPAGEVEVREETVEEWIELEDLDATDPSTQDTDETRAASGSIGEEEEQPEIGYAPSRAGVQSDTLPLSEPDLDEDVELAADDSAFDDSRDEDFRDTGIENAEPEMTEKVVTDAEERDQSADDADDQAVTQRGPARAVHRPWHMPETAAAEPDPAEELDLLPQRVRTSSPLIWKILALPLLLVLVAQLVHHHRATLARDPRIGPKLIAVYDALGLPIRPDWDLHAYEILQWHVASDPAAPGTLRVRASIKNVAEFAQPYPLLRLVLEDRWGEQVRAREFTPGEYLGADDTAARSLAPAQLANASISIVDPGPDAEGFRFDICLAGARGPVCATEIPRP